MIFNKKYEKKYQLGKGVFGEVFEVLNKKDGKSYALKFIPRVKNENANDLFENCDNKIKIMKDIKSGFIVKLIDNFYNKINDGYCLVMELYISIILVFIYYKFLIISVFLFIFM